MRAEASAERARREAYAGRVSAAAALLALNRTADARVQLARCEEPELRDLRAWEWDYLQRQLDSRLAVLAAEAPVRALAVDSGQGVLRAGGGRVHGAWELEGLSPLESPEPTGPLWPALALSEDGGLRLELRGAEERAAHHVVDARTGASLAELEVAAGPAETGAQFDARGERALLWLTTGGQGGSVRARLWDFTRGDVFPPFHVRPAGPVALSADGTRVFSSGTSFRVHDAESGALLHAGPPSTSKDICIARSRDGLLVASGGAELVLRDAQHYGSLWRADQQVDQLAFDATGSRLAAASADRVVTLWSTGRRDRLLELRGHRDALTALAFDPFTGLLAGADRRGEVSVWCAEDALSATLAATAPGPLASLDLDPAGERLLVALGKPERLGLRLWSLPGIEALPVPDPGARELEAAVFSPGGSSLATLGRSGDLVLWDALRREELWRVPGLGPAPRRTLGYPQVLAFDPRGDRLVAVRPDRVGGLRLELRSRSDGALLREVGRPEARSLIAAWSPGGEHLAVARGRAVEIWDGDLVAAGPRLHWTAGDAASALAWGPAGGRLAVGEESGRAGVHRLADGGELFELPPAESPVTGLAWTPDGRRLIRQRRAGGLEFCDPDAVNQLLVLPSPHGVRQLAAAPDGRSIFAAVVAGQVHRWSVAPPRELFDALRQGRRVRAAVRQEVARVAAGHRHLQAGMAAVDPGPDGGRGAVPPRVLARLQLMADVEEHRERRARPDRPVKEEEGSWWTVQRAALPRAEYLEAVTQARWEHLQRPRDGLPLLTLGAAWYRLGDDRHALEMLAMARAREPEQPEIQGLLAVVLHRLGRPAEARAALQRWRDRPAPGAPAGEDPQQWLEDELQRVFGG